MAAGRTSAALGWRVLGLGVAALGVVALAIGDFLPGQSAPKGLHDRTTLAYAAGAFMLAVGAGVAWRRTTAWAAAALTAYYAIVVVGLMDARVTARHLAEYGSYSNIAEQLAIAAGGLIVLATSARMDRAWANRLTHVGQAAFGVCAVLFGGAHFAYMNLTAPLVPKWLPPGQEFWGYATGAAQIAAGLAILTRVQARLAAILLTVMYAVFQVLVHLRTLLDNPASHWIWSENALNLALVGCAWVVADSFGRTKRG